MKKTEVNQIDKFKEAAKENGCDDSEKTFTDKLKKIATSTKDTKDGK